MTSLTKLLEDVLSSEDSDLIRCGKEDAANHAGYKLINEEVQYNGCGDDRRIWST